VKVGIQLYSVRNHMAIDPIKTIRDVANVGYRHIEVANHNAEVDFGSSITGCYFNTIFH